MRAAEPVDRVVTAPEDPVVGRQPVVVELVAHVADALAVRPADRRALLGAERLGDQHVVPDGTIRRRISPEQPREGAGREQHLAGAHGAGIGREQHPGAARSGPTSPRALADPHAGPLGLAREPPARAWPGARARTRSGARARPRRSASGPRPGPARGRAPRRRGRARAAPPPPRRATRPRAARRRRRARRWSRSRSRSRAARGSRGSRRSSPARAARAPASRRRTAPCRWRPRG